MIKIAGGSTGNSLGILGSTKFATTILSELRKTMSQYGTYVEWYLNTYRAWSANPVGQVDNTGLAQADGTNWLAAAFGASVQAGFALATGGASVGLLGGNDALTVQRNEDIGYETAQGALNVVNGLQDVAITMANQQPQIMPGVPIPFAPHLNIPSPDWSKDLAVPEGQSIHDWEKWVGGNAAAFLISHKIGQMIEGDCSCPSNLRNRINPRVGTPDSSLPAGTGTTDAYGNYNWSTQGTPTEQALAKAHEQVHSWLSPRYDLFNMRANLGMCAYKNSQLLRYLEEALAETIAQLRVNGANLNSIQEGLSFPLAGANNPYNLSVGGIVTEAIGAAVTAGLLAAAGYAHGARQ